MVRREWEDLPARVRSAIENKCGTVVGADCPSAGRNSDFSATLRLADDRKIFCKGITSANSPKVRVHQHEAYINRWLPHPPAPRLLWRVETDGWLLLGFDHVAGQHADLSPGSPDLPLVADTISTLARELTPCPADEVPALAGKLASMAAWRRLRHEPPGDLDPWGRTKLDCFVEWEQRAIDAVAGDSLLHADLHPLNIVVGRIAHVVDWAWSRTGAVWVDTAYLVIRLIDEGHTPQGAERWAESVPAWHESSDLARTAFAVAVFGMWEYLQHADPLPHRARLATAARRWAQHRVDPGQD